jgi:hypothetical protein
VLKGTRWGVPIIASLVLAGAGFSQDAQIEVNPNRPTFATPARTTQFGVAELEFGVQRPSPRDGASSFGTPALLKLGVADDLELRASSAGWLRQGAPGAPSLSGMADLALGVQWCYVRNGPLGVDQAIQLTHKFATADARTGLGTGAADDTVGVFFSRDVAGSHVDVNLLETWQGRPAADGGGRSKVAAATLSVSHNLTETWSLGGELYGIGGSVVARRVVSTLWYAACKLSSRLVLDAGFEVGLSDGAPRYNLFAGVTWGIGRFTRRDTPSTR